jgi:UrcA family protein
MNTLNTKNAVRMTFVAFAALSATMLAGVTNAAEASDFAPKQAVTYKDLNLHSNAGVKALYKRIEGAADQVCGNVDSRDLRAVSAKKACVDHAISSAVAAVNSPMLTMVSLANSSDSAPQSLPTAQVR